MRLGRARNILIIAAMALVIIGLSYTMAAHQVFSESARIDANLIEFVPEECRVTGASRGVQADIEFRCDAMGNIIDKTYLNLVAGNVYEGSKADYSIAIRNISEYPLVVDKYTMEIDSSNNSLADLIYFTGSVKIYRDSNEYYDVLGTFENVRLEELDETLTSIREYRKIDVDEKVVLDISQCFDDDKTRFYGKSGLEYQLKPVFVQYFPE